MAATTTRTRVRAAAAQIAPDLESATGTLARVLETLRDAARQGSGAQLEKVAAGARIRGQTRILGRIDGHVWHHDGTVGGTRVAASKHRASTPVRHSAV